MKDKILNVAIGIFAIVLILLIVFFVTRIGKEEQTADPVVVEQDKWDPSRDELYVTDDHSEFAEVYDDLGTADGLIQINDDIVSENLMNDTWYVYIEDVEYKLTFTGSTFTAEGDGTTTTGEWKKEYRSDAPQFIYMTLTSEYVNIEGFVGYNGENIWLYSNVEDELQSPPLYDYYYLRRGTDG